MRCAARTAPGKSTLGKLLAGIHTPDEGRVIIGGEPVRFTSPSDALGSGVAMVHQELSFCENLSVAENLCLGSLPSTRGFVSKREMRRRAETMLAPIDATLDVTRAVGSLTVGQQQMLQIASAIGQGARVIVFDEPTSSLSQHEAERLYSIIGRLAGARRDVHLRQPSPRGNLPALRHHHGACATAGTWRRAPPPRSTGRRSSR